MSFVSFTDKEQRIVTINTDFMKYCKCTPAAAKNHYLHQVYFVGQLHPLEFTIEKKLFVLEDEKK